MRARPASTLLLAHALLGCGAAVVRAPGAIDIGSTVRRGSVLTDLEDARDVLALGTTTFVATDDGLLMYLPDQTQPARFGRAEGLPDEDVTALGREPDQSLLVAVDHSLVSIAGSAVTLVQPGAEVGRILDLAIAPDGTAWACGLTGLARRTAGTWTRVGEAFPCTTLALTPEGAVWAGSAQGLVHVEGDTVRRHPIAGGIPEAYVRSVVPVLPGQVLALLYGPQNAVVGFFDGARWNSYTLAGIPERVVGLTTTEDGTVLVTEERVFAVAPMGPGMEFRALASNEASIQTLAAAPSAPPAEEVQASSVLRAAQSLTDAAPASSARQAAPLFARELPQRFARPAVRSMEGYVALANAGVSSLGSAPRAFRSHSLVAEEDLQVVTDLQSGVWVRGRDGDIAKWGADGRLRRLALPAGVTPQCLTSGPDGAYLVVLVDGTTTVRVLTASGTGFRSLLERTLAAPVTAIPFAGVGNDNRVWLGLRVRDGERERMRGAAVLDPASDTVVYHHRGAIQTEGGLPLADEVSGVTFDAEGNAWFASLTGAIRVEAHQAIVFDESRGVRGDVVLDMVAGAGAMWVASAEGLGSYADRRFDYVMPPVVMANRPVALAVDLRGTLWAAGRTGLLVHPGEEWIHVGAATTDAAGRAVPGLPFDGLRDVETDGASRVWILGAEGVLLLE